VSDRKRMPIGVQDFADLRQSGYAYVDKTEYIYDLVHGSKQYFLSRPRRFGKSLFLSTLWAYWSGRQELFAGLKVSALERDNPEAFQPHPVFYFDFNGKNYQTDGALEDVLDSHLCLWEEEYGSEAGRSLEDRFQRLLRKAVEKTGRSAVVLLDEYDKPLLEVLENEKLEEHNKNIFKGFFGALKKCDRYLRFVFVTGVTKFSKVSIFSDLNQLEDISLDADYACICGTTEAELEENFVAEIGRMAEDNGLSEEECLCKLKKTYDGYHFAVGAKNGVYNPYSLLNALKKRSFDSYWFATGTPTFLVKRVAKSAFELKKFSDGRLYSTKRAMSDYRADNPDLLPLLYQTGYLSIAGYDAVRQRITLSFPNEEVKYGFLDSLLPVYVPATVEGNGKDIFALDECLESGDTEGIRDILTALFASIPYTSSSATFEHYFQSVLYLLFTLLGKFIVCELHSSKGRADAVVETAEYIYIFEFKVDKSAEEALTQIREKGYALPYRADKRQVFEIGVNFDAESRSLQEWRVGK